MEVRYRVYDVQVHDYCEKCAIWLEPDDPAKKLPDFNYVTAEQMAEAKGELESAGEDGQLPLVKFFGEMIFAGHTFTATNSDTGHTTTDYAYVCNNPACKFEKASNVQYPVVQKVEGRVVRNPGELSLEDQKIRDQLKKHVGSSVMPDSEVK